MSPCLNLCFAYFVCASLAGCAVFDTEWMRLPFFLIFPASIFGGYSLVDRKLAEACAHAHL